MKKLFLFFTLLSTSYVFCAQEEAIITFPESEYNYYMNILQKNNSHIYDFFKKCEDTCGHPCLTKSKNNKYLIVQPSKKSHWYPTLLFPSLLRMSEKDQLEYLTEIILLYFNEHYDFSDEEYEKYMNTIQKINPTVYEILKKCGLENGYPCLQRTLNPNSLEIEPLSQQTRGYSIMIVPSSFITDVSQKEEVSNFLEEYKKRIELDPQKTTEEERKNVLEIVRSVAPELYEDLITIDPSGIHHIKRYYTDEYGMAIIPSLIDGFPQIFVGTKTLDGPHKYYYMAHELGHYALGHPEMNFYRQEKETKSLPYEKLLNNAFGRIKENEADRFAIVDLGIDLNDEVIEKLSKNGLEEDQTYDSEKEKRKATFQRSHPFWQKRIDNMKELSRDVELHKRRYNNQRTPIDWRALAQHYKELFASKKELPIGSEQ